MTFCAPSRLVFGLCAGLALLLLATAPNAQIRCENAALSVEGTGPKLGDAICAEAARILPAFEACGLTQFHRIVVRIVNSASHATAPSVGSYAAGGNEIVLTAPDHLATVLPPGHPYTRLDPQRMFLSLLAHEMGHALLDEAKCERARCVAEHEYVAYAMQLSLLGEEDRETLIGDQPERGAVTEESLNDFIALSDPMYFASRVWAHFRQPENDCGFVRRLIRQEVDLRMHPL